MSSQRTIRPKPKKRASSKAPARKNPSTTRRAKRKTEPRRASHDHAHMVEALLAPAVRPQPLIGVGNVAASSRWYTRLLGAERLDADSHGNTYDRILSNDRLILQLHAWDEEDHPNLAGARSALGHGLLLWFELDDFDAAVKRARAMKATVIEEPHVNPGPQHREMWLRDPDGYVVVITSPDGEAA